MRVLVVGGGAREHALVWKLQFSPDVNAVFAAPGNAGISFLARSTGVEADDTRGLIATAIENQIELTVVGPEAPLAAGLVDAFQDAGLRIFGPTRAAAQIEWSKSWAKGLMQRHGIPTARWMAADTPDEAREALEKFGLPVVLKADGLASGKGVVICRTHGQAEQAINSLMVDRTMGVAGERLVIEELLEGAEYSAFALVSGMQVLPLIGARDHKRLMDGDEGPNTGGMGGYAPTASGTPELLAEIRRMIFEPTARAMVEEGAPYSGVLYAGLMLTTDGPKVIEFNCRWGDPEAELILPLLKSDLVPLLMATIDGTLDQQQVEWHDGATCGVVLAAPGYPDSPKSGFKITGLNEIDDGVLAFHAGTKLLRTPEPPRGWVRRRVPRPMSEDDVGVVTDGGRILTVVARGATLQEARARVYDNVARVHFEGMQYRRDIGITDPTTAAIHDMTAAGSGSQLQPTAGEPPIDERMSPGEYLIPAAPAPNPMTEEPPPPFVAPTESEASIAATGPLTDGPGPSAEPQPAPAAAAPQPETSPEPAPGSASESLVAVLMGSESDRPVMDETAKALVALGIAHEVHVMSAHRTPERVRQFARGAEARGLRVIIAGAGGAAHLPGVIAAQTTLPVIGVPILGSSMMGLDSLLSMVQMPGGVPVATVAVGTGGARNAAYLAAAIIGLADEGVRARYRKFRVDQSGGELE
ncbi:MAG: phosphoribosylamine---glycine ligase [Chloroflexota bacterium]|jgi:phosphoribosylamine--glycine ligase|nr:phosphoribosylamine---glycine ligase [Chloroflexota bacterium]